MTDFTIEKTETKEDREKLNLHFQYVVARGFDSRNIVLCHGTLETQLAEATLIALQNDFDSANVLRSPEAVFASRDQLVVGFKKDADARLFRHKLQQLEGVLRGPGPRH